MYFCLKFLSLATATLVFSQSMPQPLVGTTLNGVAADLQGQTIDKSKAEAEQLSQEGIEQLNRGQLLKAANTLEQALEIYTKLDEPSLQTGDTGTKEIEILKKIIGIYTSLKNSNKTIEFSNAMLARVRELEDRDTELKLQMALADAYNSSGQYEKAVESARASLVLARELQNFQAEAVTFLTLASAYQSLASTNREYRAETKAAAISGLTTAWKVKDPDLEAKALAILGSAFSSLDKNQNAIVFAEQGLKVAKENNIPNAAASSLLTLGGVRLKEGEYRQAIESIERGMEYLKKLQQRELEGAASVTLGLAYLGEGNSQQSLNFAEQGLALSQEVKGPLIEALALVDLSLNYSNSGDYQKAIASIDKSRVIAKEQNNRDLEALVLEVKGGIYRKARQKDQAIASYQESISIKDSYSVQASLAQIYQEANLVATAIAHYKRAINKNEEEARRGIPGLPPWLQESFPQAIQNINGLRTTDIYRSLSNLLLSQRRIIEAQQVLELLKEQELREYTDNTTRRELPARVTLTAIEEQIFREYGSLLAFGKRIDECQQTRCQELEQLLARQTVLTEQYYQALRQLETEVNARAAAGGDFVDSKQFAPQVQAIVEAQPGTVLIYPLVLEDKLWLLWASKDGIFKSVEVSGVSQAQLAETVRRFRQLLQNRLSNIDEVKATGKQLHDWLIAPLAAELKANNIRNLVFALDSTTRYVPMGALFDGEKYLIENYTISTVVSANLTATQPTPGSSTAQSLVKDQKVAAISLQLKAPLTSDRTPTVLALGVSEAMAGFKSLPNVPAELDAIVRQESVNSKGIYSGQKFLNQAFDFFALKNNLADRQLLHIATHSEFVPGRASKSYLLLGTGQKLAVPDIETWLNLRDINLVVLSACETALGGLGLDGREIVGVGYYFLKGGANTVMATLWSVDDQSTRLLMEEFYQDLAKGTLQSPVTKAEALRQAQLLLLNGKDTAEAQTQITSESLPKPATAPPTGEQSGDSLQPVAKKSYFRHPYYWASFILMGSGL